MDTKENTSHQLRDSLKRAGWRVQEADTEVRLIPPDISTPLAEIDRLLGGSGSEDDSEEDVALVFTLEYQLRDFLAENIETITNVIKLTDRFVSHREFPGFNRFSSWIGPSWSDRFNGLGHDLP